MGRGGRPRKHKQREPSGRGSRAAAARANREFAKWQRRHTGVDVDHLLQPEAGTPLGRLLLTVTDTGTGTTMINRREYEAGLDYRSAVIMFRVTAGLPMELPSRIRLGGSDHSEFPDDVVRSCRRRYSTMRSVLRRAGKGVLEAVHQTAVSERDGADVNLLKRGLGALLIDRV